jgi:hypothetical protein
MISNEFLSGYSLRPDISPKYGVQRQRNRFVLNALLNSTFFQ